MIASAAEPPALRMVVPMSEARICSEVTAPDGIMGSILSTVYKDRIYRGINMFPWDSESGSLSLLNNAPARGR